MKIKEKEGQKRQGGERRNKHKYIHNKYKRTKVTC